MSTRFTASVGFDLTCIVCAALSVGVGCVLYALVNGWLSQ